MIGKNNPATIHYRTANPFWDLTAHFTFSIFNGMPKTFEVARYHSLYGIRDKLPDCLDVTALTEDGIVMGIKHKSLPFAAVQFHPESILTSPAHGMIILQNALSFLQYQEAE